MWLEHLAGMELMVKRVKLAESELLVAKGIRVTRDQMDTMGNSVILGHLEKTEARVTQAFLEDLDLLVLRVIEDQRVNVDILELQDLLELKDLRDPLDHLDEKACREGEETTGPREQRAQTGHEERRENQVKWEAGVGQAKTDSREQRETRDCQGQGVVRESQESLEEMAPWEILEILDHWESLGRVDQRATQEGRDSTTQGREDPPETKENQGERDQGGAEGSVVPKQNLEMTEP